MVYYVTDINAKHNHTNIHKSYYEGLSFLLLRPYRGMGRLRSIVAVLRDGTRREFKGFHSEPNWDNVERINLTFGLFRKAHASIYQRNDDIPRDGHIYLCGTCGYSEALVDGSDCLYCASYHPEMGGHKNVS